jgi:hypothetical protein
MNVMRTSRCGTVNTEILPVCSMDTRNSMESVNCTPVQVKVKQTGRCGTVRSRVLPVCSINIGNGVQTASGTSCDKQEQKYTIDKEWIGSGIIDSGVCGSTPVCEDGVAAVYCHTEKGENTKNNFSHGLTAIGEQQQQKVQSDAKNGLESGNDNRRTPPACLVVYQHTTKTNKQTAI